MDTLERLKRLLDDRGWTEYRLSKECGLAQSTIGNIYRRNTEPSLATLEAICKGFNITLSQFFSDNEMVELTPELKELFDYWANLTPKQKNAVFQMIQAMSNSESMRENKKRRLGNLITGHRSASP